MSGVMVRQRKRKRGNENQQEESAEAAVAGRLWALGPAKFIN